MYTYVHNNPLMFFDPLGMQKSHNSRRKSGSRSKKKRTPSVKKLAKPNECGPSKYPALEYAVPDTVGDFWGWGTFGDKYNLTPACNKHDICYSTCGKTQVRCDREFGEDIYDECRRGGGAHLNCLRYLILYEVSVALLGRLPYKYAQEEAGCTPCMDIPLHLTGP